MATKRNRWHKKQLRIASRSYRVCQTIYISKKRRAETRAWSLKMAKAIWEAQKEPYDQYEVIRAYVRGDPNRTNF